MAEIPQLNLATLDMMCKDIEETLDAPQMQHNIMMIGSSQMRGLVDTTTADKLQLISSQLNDIKGELSGIKIINKISGGSYPRKTLRKLHKKSRRTRKH